MSCSFWSWLSHGFKCPVQPWFIGVFVRDTNGQPVAGAQVSMKGTSLPTNQDGWVGFDNVSSQQNFITLVKSGFPTYHVDFFGPTELSGVSQNIGIGSPADITLPAWQSLTVGTESGLIHIEGTDFKTEGGLLWQWRGVTDFLLFWKFLEGQDTTEIVNERIKLGFNTFRVLGMNGWPQSPNFFPQAHADYYTKLNAFVDFLASKGMRVEFVVFADSQRVMPDEGERNAHAARVIDTLKGKWNVFIEWVNEPFQNIPGGGQGAYNVGKPFQYTTPLLMASGDYSDPPLVLDYLTIHTDRGGEWPRKSKDAVEYQWAFHILTIGDEPMGAAEFDQPGRRSNVVSDFGDAAGVLALQTNGGTFHSEEGLYSNPFGPIVTACAKAWVTSMKVIGPVAHIGQYTAGHLGNCPFELDDAHTLRIFAQLMGSEAWVVVVRPTADWTPVLKNGWRIESNPAPRIYHVVL